MRVARTFDRSFEDPLRIARAHYRPDCRLQAASSGESPFSLPTLPQNLAGHWPLASIVSHVYITHTHTHTHTHIHTDTHTHTHIHTHTHTHIQTPTHAHTEGCRPDKGPLALGARLQDTYTGSLAGGAVPLELAASTAVVAAPWGVGESLQGPGAPGEGGGMYTVVT